MTPQVVGTEAELLKTPVSLAVELYGSGPDNFFDMKEQVTQHFQISNVDRSRSLWFYRTSALKIETARDSTVKDRLIEKSVAARLPALPQVRNLRAWIHLASSLIFFGTTFDNVNFHVAKHIQHLANMWRPIVKTIINVANIANIANIAKL